MAVLPIKILVMLAWDETFTLQESIRFGPNDKKKIGSKMRERETDTQTVRGEKERGVRERGGSGNTKKERDRDTLSYYDYIIMQLPTRFPKK